MDTAKPTRFRFGPFEADAITQELFEEGEPVPLQSKPFQFLLTLLQNQGLVVTREQMSHVLWPDIYVQVNQGLNAAARKVRIALKDQFNEPKYFETLGSYGYRFIHAAEILAWSSTSIERSDRLIRVAVLPFRVEGDGREEWGTGVAGELISMLGRTHPRLKVIAPTSVQVYSKETKPPKAVAAELGVRYLLFGRLVQERERSSIKARFLDVEKDRIIWEGSCSCGHIADALNEVGANVVRSMQPELLPASASAPGCARVKTRTLGDYFRAQQLWFRRASNLRDALAAYQGIAEQDPQFAAAHAGTANAWIMLAAHDRVTPRAAYQAALAASQRALDLREDLPEALVAQAWARLALDRDWATATRIFEHVLHLNSSYAFAYVGYGHLLLARARVDEAVLAIEQGYRLDPLSGSIGASLSTALYYARRYDEAIQLARRVLETDPDNCQAVAMLGAAYLAQRRYGDALQQFEASVQCTKGEEPVMEAHLAHAYAEVGKAANAEVILHRLESRDEQAPKPAYHIALIRLVLGDVNGAVHWLERACQERSHRTLFLGVDPRLDMLRGTKHFDEMCRHVREPDLRQISLAKKRYRVASGE